MACTSVPLAALGRRSRHETGGSETMASVDLDAKPEHDASAPPTSTVSSPAPRIAWDPSVGPIPIGFGWDAEPLVLDWHGEGERDLLVTAGGGPRGRRARVFRPLE